MNILRYLEVVAPKVHVAQKKRGAAASVLFFPWCPGAPERPFKTKEQRLEAGVGCSIINTLW
jgi:hypothetical protein